MDSFGTREKSKRKSSKNGTSSIVNAVSKWNKKGDKDLIVSLRQNEKKEISSRSQSIFGRVISAAKSNMCGSGKKMSTSDSDSDLIGDAKAWKNKQEKKPEETSFLDSTTSLVRKKPCEESRPLIYDDIMLSLIYPINDKLRLKNNSNQQKVPNVLVSGVSPTVALDEVKFIDEEDEEPVQVKIGEKAASSQQSKYLSYSDVNKLFTMPLKGGDKIISPNLTKHSPLPEPINEIKARKPKRRVRKTRTPDSDSSADEKPKKEVVVRIKNEQPQIVDLPIVVLDRNIRLFYSTDSENEAKAKALHDRRIKIRPKQNIAQAYLSDNDDSVEKKSKQYALPTVKSGVCPLCNTDLRIPVKIDCGHVVCAECLQSAWTEFWMDIWCLPHECPICNQPIKNLEVKIEEHQKNELHLIDVYNNRIGRLSRTNYSEVKQGCCSICKNQYRGSILLRCGHKFCVQCAIHHWETSEEFNNIPVNCPICRSPAPFLISLMSNDEQHEFKELLDVILVYNEEIMVLEEELRKTNSLS